MKIQDSWLVNQFIAHRGFHDKENPENTLGAFQRAIEHNYAIECDVQMLADGTLVIIHDSTLSRLTGVDGYLSQMTYPEISKLKINKTKFGIPTVKEVLETVKGQVPIMFDIKDFGVKHVDKLERTLTDLLENYQGQYAIQSSNPFVILWFKNNKPNVMRGIVSSFYSNEIEGRQYIKSWVVRKLLKRMVMNKKIQPDFISYHWANLPNIYLRRWKNLPVLAWAVSSQEEYMKVVKYVDNIIFENFEPKI